MGALAADTERTCSMHKPTSGQDPICGMWVDGDESVTTVHYLGRVYTFCSQECYAIFAHAPERIVTLLAHDPVGHYRFLCARQREQLQAP